MKREGGGKREADEKGRVEEAVMEEVILNRWP